MARSLLDQADVRQRNQSERSCEDLCKLSREQRESCLALDPLCIYCTSEPDALSGCPCAHAPCVHDLNQRRKDTLEFIVRMDCIDDVNTEDFHAAIKEAFRLGIVNDESVAHTMSMSRTSVSRWKQGINAPHPAMRPGVYSWLKNQAEAALGECEK